MLIRWMWPLCVADQDTPASDRNTGAANQPSRLRLHTQKKTKDDMRRGSQSEQDSSHAKKCGILRNRGIYRAEVSAYMIRIDR